jgi:hypothetical protein
VVERPRLVERSGDDDGKYESKSGGMSIGGEASEAGRIGMGEVMVGK